MKFWYIFLFALVGFSLLALITLSLLTPQIESRLKDNVTAVLIENNLNWVNVSAEGRSITLKGQSPTHWLHLKAQKLALDVSGVKKVNSEITIIDSLKEYALTANYDGNKLSMKGYALDQQTYQYVDDSIYQVYGQNKVISKWQFREGQPSTWAMVTAGIVSTLKRLNYGKVIFKNKTVILSGVATSTIIKNKIEKKLLAYSNQGYHLQTDIKVVTPAMSCQKKFKRILEQEQISFRTGGFAITPKSYALLSRLQTVINECERFNLIISGHTDSEGDEEINQTLSLSRAKAVSRYLIKQGTSAYRLSTMGHGQLKPIGDNDTEAGRLKNRRIEFTIKGI
jgi:OOP family OmpA-OmpF porin